jgi:hypothetical protein
MIESNESCQVCGEPLAGGYVEMRTASGITQRMCFDCARAEVEITMALDEMEENDGTD